MAWYFAAWSAIISLRTGPKRSTMLFRSVLLISSMHGMVARCWRVKPYFRVKQGPRGQQCYSIVRLIFLSCIQSLHDNIALSLNQNLKWILPSSTISSPSFDLGFMHHLHKLWNHRFGIARQKQSTPIIVLQPSLRYWNWNYRGCWHQTCPPIGTRKEI